VEPDYSMFNQDAIAFANALASLDSNLVAGSAPARTLANILERILGVRIMNGAMVNANVAILGSWPVPDDIFSPSDRVREAFRWLANFRRFLGIFALFHAQELADGTLGSNGIVDTNILFNRRLVENACTAAGEDTRLWMTQKVVEERDAKLAENKPSIGLARNIADEIQPVPLPDSHDEATRQRLISGFRSLGRSSALTHDGYPGDLVIGTTAASIGFRLFTNDMNFYGAFIHAFGKSAAIHIKL